MLDKGKRLYVVMVGLPARGKTTIATKLKENLMRDSVKTRIFNNGELRRKMIKENTSYADFFDPRNMEGVALREKIGRINMERARRYLKGDGNVAILDATHANVKRRKLIRALLSDHPILFIECVNDDRDILQASILRKIDLPEFGHLNQNEAIESFRQRIAYYHSIYHPLEKEGNFVKLDSLNNRIIEEEILEDVPYVEQIRDFLLTDMVKNLYLIRHGETHFNIENRIGGDSDLTEKGKVQAETLARYFRKKRIPLIFTSEKKRTIQTAIPIKEAQEECTIIPLPEFNEIHSGICECLSYEEIKAGMPEVYAARKRDKYNYVYPQGEGYVSMERRIERGIKKALYLSKPSDNIMVIGHRAANRMILSHFLFRRREDVPYIYIPQHKFYYISATQNRKVFQLKTFY
ncbi:MAG: histidine phosphatase family protein [Deltaproteobacteria bacterium]|nr:histidine phosphatase family protein [Deltaproteobacteria bacterium]